ncbi:MAG TPA: hypothetical protein VIO37_10985 [Candidatus Dormibacteraeota bacterium]
MQTKWLVAGTTAGLTLISLALTRVIWPDAPGAAQPSAGLLPFYIMVGLVESFAFGLGVAFLIFGWRTVSSFGQRRGLAMLTYLSIGWLLINWWPHDNLHRVVGTNFSRLIWIEYGFHLTLIAAAACVAYFFVTTLRGMQSRIAAPTART